MKKLIELLASLGKSLSGDVGEEQIVVAVKAAIGEKDAAITTLQAEVDGMKELAAVGRKYRDDLTSRYVAAKSKLEEVAATDDAHKGMKTVVDTFPLAFVELEVKALEKRVAAKFPAESQLAGEDGNPQREKSADDTNPLVPQPAKE